MFDENGDEVANASVTWSSSDEDVTEIGEDGSAVAIGVGAAFGCGLTVAGEMYVIVKGRGGDYA